MRGILPKIFVDEYRSRPVAFGWNGLGEVVFKRTYSRSDNPNIKGMEGWADVCERVINGMYAFQQEHCAANGIGWNREKALRSAQEAFDMMFNMKWTPPGRGLWMAGTEFIHGRGVVEAMQNCAFISTAYIKNERGSIFSWLMEMSMLGVGVGFDTRGAGKVTINKPSVGHSSEIVGPCAMQYIVPDTRQGWAKSVEMLIDSYLDGSETVLFDYSLVRPKGSSIHGFGGVASGPGPLIEMHNSIRRLLDSRVSNSISSRDIVDLCNMIGKCVVSGNVRRSAEIAFGDKDDSTFIDLKNYKKFPERADYGWISNNSIFAEVGMDYNDVAQRTYDNGEPGYFWIENAQNYGRMNGIFDTSDDGVMGGNPCMEQMLHHREMCTLVEIYMPRCRNKQEFERAIKYAYLYGKSVTLASNQIGDPQTREVMLRNRRIGLSVTGITQFIGAHGMLEARDWLDHGYHISGYYDQLYSQWLGVNRSVRRTSVKPSGTVSLVVGVTPGVHYNVASRFHIRRVIIASDSPLVESLRLAGYPVEQSVYDTNGMSVSFPVDAGPGVKSEDEVSMNAQLKLIAMVQRHWADNAVSATVKFDKEKVGPRDIAVALEVYENELKGISFLPSSDNGYAQAPYESISEEQYKSMMGNLETARLDGIGIDDKQLDMYCDGDACQVEWEANNAR